MTSPETFQPQAADGHTLVPVVREVLSDLDTPIATAVPDGSGNFAFPNVALASGANPFRVVATTVAGNTSFADGTIVGTASDTSAPTVTVGLLRDTGRDATDRVTFDATITGAVDDASAIATFRVVNGKVAETWLNADILGMLQQLGAVPAPG